MRSFGSDNNSGVHPEIMAAIVASNCDHVPGYGSDPYTEKATAIIKSVFGESAEPFFVFNGTGANTIAITACTHSFNSVIAADSAHIVCDECGAPAKASGCAISVLSGINGKLTPELIQRKLTGFGVAHHSQPKVIYISQCTEFGTIYSLEEIRAIADLAHAHDMYLLMDGARIHNAAAALGVSMKEMTVDCGVDILSLGGTKNGMMMGEAVVSFRSEITCYLEYVRKQSAQLFSKMRYISAQFIPYFEQEIWLTNALHANNMAKRLEEEIKAFGRFDIVMPVDANILFVKMEKEVSDRLLKKQYFYVWDEHDEVVRFVTTWDTTEEDIRAFIADLSEIAG
ncbi:MAG: threonine aldolase family protein [Bacteroidales bacterium]